MRICGGAVCKKKKKKKSSDSNSQMHGGVRVPCKAERHSGVRQKACVLSLILSVSRCCGAAASLQRSSAGLPLTRANVYQIRHIKKLIVPLGLNCSLSEPVHTFQRSRSRDRGGGRLTHTSMVSGSARRKQASTRTARGCSRGVLL